MQTSGWVTGNRNTVLKNRGSKEKHKKINANFWTFARIMNKHRIFPKLVKKGVKEKAKKIGLKNALK